MKVCKNCGWQGESEQTVNGHYQNCPVCGDKTEEIVDINKVVESPKEVVENDLNGDGVFDKDDKKIAARALASSKGYKGKRSR